MKKRYIYIITLLSFAAVIMWNQSSRSRISESYVDEFNAFERKRIKLYLAGLTDAKIPSNPIYIQGTTEELQTFFVSMDPSSPLHLSANRYWWRFNFFLKQELDEIYSKYPTLPRDRLLRISVGDTDSIGWFDYPTIVKARAIHGNKPHATLGRLRGDFHFGKVETVLKYEATKQFKDKSIPKLVWRGQPTGVGSFGNQGAVNLFPPELLKNRASRQVLVETWFGKNDQELDIGLTDKSFSQYFRDVIPIYDMLEYKYILSVEGNDVATGLKWNMASKSLVLMPIPSTESWFLESLLEPWVHFVPVKNDFSDLLEKKRWCDAHVHECEEIIANANAYVKQFIDRERELYLFYTILKLYLRYVHFQCV